MTAALIIALLALLALLGLLVYAGVRIEGLQSEVTFLREDSHATCVHSVKRAVGMAHAAEVLDQAAVAYDGLAAKARMQVLAREQYTPEGPSMPALWMRDRAEECRRINS